MLVYDTPLQPRALAPANTSEATLWTTDDDCVVQVNATNLGAAQIKVNVGILPSGGSTFWVLEEAPVAVGDAYINLGPFPLRNGDAIRVKTDTANDAQFSLTGWGSTSV